MRKHRIEYGSLLDALIAVTKRLNAYENRYKVESEEFFDKYMKEETEDSEHSIEWANDYQHYLSIHRPVNPEKTPCPCPHLPGSTWRL